MKYIQPIKFSDKLPDIGQRVIALCDYSNSTRHVVREITNDVYWFNVQPFEICNKDISEEYTHWIAVDHPDKWGK